MQEYDQHIQNVASPTIVPHQSKVATHEHRIDVGQEPFGLLGYEIFSGKLVLDKRSKSRSTEDQSGPGIEIREADGAKLTSKALVWGSQKLSLADVVSVLNGIINRGGHKEAMSIPIGIIPAGSDNSLVLTILGVRDPISAAITIIKGGLTAMDVLAVEWIQTGSIHYGTTASYFGFVSNVLDYSEKYQTFWASSLFRSWFSKISLLTQVQL